MVGAPTIPAGPPSLESLPAIVPSKALHGHSVLWFLLRRIGTGIITLWVVSILIFLCCSVLPGDAVSVVLGKSGTPEVIAAIKARMGLDHSLIQQYWDWLTGLFHGDFGDSAVALVQQQPDPSIAHTLRDPLINSFILGTAAALLLVPITLVLGAVAGIKANRAADHLISLPSLVLAGLPEFVSGALLIWLFFTTLHVLPPVSLVAPGSTALADPKVLILPVATLLLVAVGSGVRQVRLGMIEVLQTDFIQFARLNGVSEGRVLMRYGIRNAIANSIQTIAQNLQYLVGGIIVVEAVFTYPGIGVYLVQAVLARDTPKVLAASIILAAFYTLLNIIADLIVVFLVPKLRTELI